MKTYFCILLFVVFLVESFNLPPFWASPWACMGAREATRDELLLKHTAEHVEMILGLKEMDEEVGCWNWLVWWLGMLYDKAWFLFACLLGDWLVECDLDIFLVLVGEYVRNLGCPV